MTDKEIIKALTKAVFIGDSPIGKGFGTIVDKQLLSNTVDLINRQKAEIERLKTAYPNTLESIRKIYTTAKSEAIKELLERFKLKYANHSLAYTTTLEIFFCMLNDTAKEMVGENNDSRRI